MGREINKNVKNKKLFVVFIWIFPDGAGVNVGDVRDVGLIFGSGRSPGGRHGSPLSILAWRIPWTEEPGGLQSAGSHRVGHD